MQISLFDESKRCEKLTKMGDSLEQLNTIVNWKMFKPILNQAIRRENNPKGGRPPLDNLLMFKVLDSVVTTYHPKEQGNEFGRPL
jgi:hypothetical protein